MSAWDAAAAIVHQAFADLEPLIYQTGDTVIDGIYAIRSDRPAPDFEGAGRTLRTVIYEIRQSDLQDRPVKGDFLFHRHRRWRVEDVTTLDDVAAWEVIVTDAGEAL